MYKYLLTYKDWEKKNRTVVLTWGVPIYPVFSWYDDWFKERPVTHGIFFATTEYDEESDDAENRFVRLDDLIENENDVPWAVWVPKDNFVGFRAITGEEVR